MFLKKIVLTRQTNQKSAVLVTTGIFQIKGLSFNHAYAVDPMICLLMMSMNLSNIAILKIKSADYHILIGGISKSEAINLKQYIDLIEKGEAL